MKSARYVTGWLLPVLLGAGVWALAAGDQFGESPGYASEMLGRPLEAEKMAVLSAEVSGVVKEIAYRPQEFVRAGDVLVQLDTDLIQIETERIQLQIDLNTSKQEAEIAVSFNQKFFDVIKKMYDTEIGTDRVRVAAFKEFADAQQRLEMARLQKTKAQAEVGTLELNLKYNQEVLARHSLCAPFDGVIVPFSNTSIPRLEDTKAVEVGETVQNGQPVVALMAVDHLRVPWKLSTQLLGEVVLGQKARVLVEGFPTAVEGEVVYISPALITRDEFEIEVRIANPARDVQAQPGSVYRYAFRPGMWATVELVEAP